MSCLMRNCRRLGNPRKVPVLKKEVSSKGPSFNFLCETRLTTAELRGVARKLGFDFCLAVDCVFSVGGRSGGLGFLWKVDCSVELKSFSHNHIDVLVGEVDKWHFTGVYGYPEDTNKWRTWELLERLSNGCSVPWLCVGGDFNEIMFDHEKIGGSLRRDDRMRDFRHCVENCGLTDIGFEGFPFTWTNKRSGRDNIQERLDRGLANDSWRMRFPHSRVSHLTRLMSDHCSILVEINSKFV